MKTLFLHIGTPKTGTSAIQGFLDDNAGVLEKKGYCFRTFPYTYEDKTSRKRNAHFLIGKIYDENGAVDRAKMESRIQDTLETIAGWFKEMDYVILSDESLWNVLRGKGIERYAQLQSFCEAQGAQLKVIVYLRRQDEWLYSCWKQYVSTGIESLEWEDYAAKPPKKVLLDYDAHLNEIEKVVGQENIIVRHYDMENFSGAGGTIYSDFLEVLGLDFTDDYTIVRNFVNTSINANFTEIKRILNQLQGENVVKNNSVSRYFKDNAIQCMKKVQPAPKTNPFSPAEKKEFLKQYTKGNQKVSKRYFTGERELFNYDSQPYPKWDRNNEKMLEDVILFFGELALWQKQEIDNLKSELKQIKKECALNDSTSTKE